TCNLHAPTRRELLLASGTLFAWAYLPKAARAQGRDPRLLVIVLRGALDGLAAVAPVGDPDWVRLRGDKALTLDGKPPALTPPSLVHAERRDAAAPPVLERGRGDDGARVGRAVARALAFRRAGRAGERFRQAGRNRQRLAQPRPRRAAAGGPGWRVARRL